MAALVAAIHGVAARRTESRECPHQAMLVAAMTQD